MCEFPADPDFDDDDTGADEYWERLFPPGHDRGTYFEWFRTNGARSWCQRIAVLRNEGRAHWIEQHGCNPVNWPLPHPPVVIWMPYTYVALCAGCYWLNHRVDNGAQAAGSTLLHTLEHCDDPADLERWGRPLKVWHDPRIEDRPPEDWVG